jgi:hypothetical protein
MKRRSCLSIRNGVLLYKLFIRPMIDYACPIWRSAARFPVMKLQVLQSKCIRTATNALLYIGNRQIHEDLGVIFLVDITSLTERFNSKLADMGNRLVRHFGRYLRWLSVDPGLLKEGDRCRQAWIGYLPKGGHVDILNRAELAVFDYLSLGFSMLSSSVVRQMPGISTQRWCRPALFRGMAASLERMNFTSNLNFNFRHD